MRSREKHTTSISCVQLVLVASLFTSTMGAGGRPDPSAALPAVSEHAWRRGSMLGLSLWTQLFNHGAFAALFLWRALTQVGAASEELSLERSMIAEVVGRVELHPPRRDSSSMKSVEDRDFVLS